METHLLKYTHAVVVSFNTDSDIEITIVPRSDKGMATPYPIMHPLFDVTNEKLAAEIKGNLDAYNERYPFVYEDFVDLRPMFDSAFDQLGSHYGVHPCWPESPEEQRKTAKVLSDLKLDKRPDDLRGHWLDHASDFDDGADDKTSYLDDNNKP